MNIKNLEEKLVVLAKDLNKQSINWALGASFLLYLEGYDCTVNDIDIIVDAQDNKKLLELLKGYSYKVKESDGIYQTSYFYDVSIDDVDFDIMIGFKVKTSTGLYEFPFKVNKSIQINDTAIHLGSIKEWCNAYQAMGRDQKVSLLKKGIKKV